MKEINGQAEETRSSEEKKSLIAGAVTAENKALFYETLDVVQLYLSDHYRGIFKEIEGVSNEQKKEQILAYISEALRKEKCPDTGIAENLLLERLYLEIRENSFLTEYLEMPEVEEITVNSFDDVQISYNNGKKEPCAEIFNSPAHSKTVLTKMLRESGMLIDESNPIARGHLRDMVRITAYQYPVIPESAGSAMSIRLINPQKLTKEDFINLGTATEEMIDLLTSLFVSGVSMVSIGATGSGKTTLMSYLLSQIPNDQRIITIENQVREFNLVRRDEHGVVLNDVLHLVTKEYEGQPERNIDQETLLEYALTSNPDVICVGECKSAEAFTAQEAARTGHTVITTTHANSCHAAYDRLVTLCSQKKYNLDEKTLFNLMTEAFPITFFLSKDKRDNVRRVTEILECESGIGVGGKRTFRTLYRYIKGIGFVKENDISDTLKARLEAAA
jgi:pilus assembly protein CpaF